METHLQNFFFEEFYSLSMIFHKYIDNSNAIHKSLVINVLTEPSILMVHWRHLSLDYCSKPQHKTYISLAYAIHMTLYNTWNCLPTVPEDCSNDGEKVEHVQLFLKWSQAVAGKQLFVFPYKFFTCWQSTAGSCRLSYGYMETRLWSDDEELLFTFIV